MADPEPYRPKIGYINVPTTWDSTSKDNAPSELWVQHPNKKEAEHDRERARFYRLDRELIVEVTTTFRVIDWGKEPPTPTEADLKPLSEIFAEHKAKQAAKAKK